MSASRRSKVHTGPAAFKTSLDRRADQVRGARNRASPERGAARMAARNRFLLFEKIEWSAEVDNVLSR